MNYLKIFLVSLPIFFLIDMLWLGLIAKNFYSTHLGYLMGDVKWLPAIIFYLLFIVGLTYFVIAPALKGGSVGTLVVSAALFGLISYATYDLTNHATIKDWPMIVTIVDMIWGVVLSTVVSVLSYYVYNIGSRLAESMIYYQYYARYSQNK